MLLYLAVTLLLRNESQAVKVAAGLREASGRVVNVDAEHPDPSTNGQLVYVTGMATADKPVKDPVFHVRAKALVLSRTVSMYQWVENDDVETQNGHTIHSYTYSKHWNAEPISSGDFSEPKGHENPPMPVQSQQFVAAAHCGALTLDPSLTAMLANGQPLQLPANQALRRGWRRTQQGVYKGADPNNPAIGDLRVSFAITPNQMVSVVAANQAGALTTYQTTNGATIELIATGLKPESALFRTAQIQNQEVL